MLYKKCRLCGEMKEITEFHKKNGAPDGVRNECKECVKIYLKKWKDTPEYKQREKEYDDKRYSEKREKILERKKEHYQENRDKLLAYKKEYRSTDEYKEHNKKWRSDNKIRLDQLQANYREKYPHVIAWRSILHSTLNRLGKQKEGHTILMLGYSALELKEHIEKQFLEGMTWDNHGEWHIDHIKAVTNFSNIASIKEVCALTNLQPLWAFDNRSKNRH